jgi:pilus assembly protein Flp/PilA
MHQIGPLARLASDRGATATEYAILVTFIAIAIVGAIALFGNNLAGLYGSFAGAL